MSWIDLAVLALLGAGLAFYAAGSLGSCAFPTPPRGCTR